MSESPHVVYYLYNAHHILLYIGVTCDWPKRQKSHARSKPWYGEVTSHVLERFPTHKEACDREHQQINALRPPHNRSLHHQGYYNNLNVDSVKVPIELTPEVTALLERLDRKLGVGQRGVMEQAIRKLAEAEGVRE